MAEILEILHALGGFEWGPAVPQYFFFTGISAAAFLISSLTYGFGQERYRPVAGLALILALTVLMAAPLNLIADLGQPGRFYSLLFRIHLTSPMSWGVFLLSLYPLLIAVEILFAFRAGAVRRGRAADGWQRQAYRLLALGSLEITPETEVRDHRVSRALALVGIPMALAVHGYTGFILYFAMGRELWNTPLMPVIFLVSAVVSGLGLMILLTWLMARHPNGQPRWGLMESLGILLAWSILLDLALRLAWHGMAYLAAPHTYSRTLEFLFQERFFESVILEIGLALLLPALVMLVPVLRRTRPLMLLAAFLTVAGVWLFRWSTVIGGQEIPKVAAGSLEYAPVLWGGKGLMQVVGNWGFWLFLFIIFTWVLPWQHEQIEPAPAGEKPVEVEYEALSA
jgi:tetrathionate reductase subunit C